MRRWLNHPDGCARPGELGLSYPFGGPQEPWVLDTPALPGAEMPRTDLQQPNAFLDSLPGYNSSEQAEQNLEWARIISEADRYIPRIVSFPPPDSVPEGASPAPGITFQNGETKSGSFAIPPYSFLLNISVFASDIENVKLAIGPAAVWFRLFDVGANRDLFNEQYSLADLQAGNNSDRFETIFGNEPYGPYWLRSPHSVAPPGEFQWSITNVGIPSTIPTLIQFALTFGVPLTVANLGVTADDSTRQYAFLPGRPESPGGF